MRSGDLPRTARVSLPFLVAAIVLLTPPPLAGLIALVHVADWLRHRHQRSRRALACNAAVYIASAVIAQAIYERLWLAPGVDMAQPACLFAGLVAAASFGILQRLLLTATIWYARHVTPREQHLFDGEAILTDAALLVMGLPLAHVAASAPWAAALALAPLWLIHRALDLPRVRAERRLDGLTDLFTAPYLTETCTRELNRARRFKRQTVLLLLDIDGLGTINAEHGHPGGDAVIRATARTIKRATREYDLAARLAGGHFAILLPETDLAQAQVVAERIRRDAAAGHHEIPGSVEQVPLTVSIGAAVLPGGNATATQLVDAARGALARAKGKGGNRVEFTYVEGAPERGDLEPALVPFPTRAVQLPSAMPTRSPAPRGVSLWRGVLLSFTVVAVVAGVGHLFAPATVSDWRLLVMLGCLAALGGLGLAFRNLTMALALAFELHVASARMLAARYWRLWPLYLALAAIGFVVAYAYQKFGLPVALGLGAAALAFRQLAGQYVDRTLESVRTLRNANQQLEHRAFHDPLTGLANRALFSERLERALLRAGTASVAVLFIDLDNFKPVNDTLGHAAGDALLVAASRRLMQCVRREDSIARLGGDEFTVLLEEMRDPSDAARLAERIGDALAAPFPIADQQVNVSSSIGIALDTDRSHGPGDLMREADMAMYRAKSGGKARYEIFDPGMGSRAAERLELETELRGAVERDELAVRYVALPGTDVFEAVLDWRHPRRGRLTLADFEELADATGARVVLGQWLLARVAADSSPTSPRRVLVPVSQRELEEPDYVERVAALLPSRAGVCLALPESALALEGDLLARLAAVGVSLALDRVGSGVLSLERLAAAPVTTLRLAPGASRDLRNAARALAGALDVHVIESPEKDVAAAA